MFPAKITAIRAPAITLMFTAPIMADWTLAVIQMPASKLHTLFKVPNLQPKINQKNASRRLCCRCQIFVILSLRGVENGADRISVLLADVFLPTKAISRKSGSGFCYFDELLFFQKMLLNFLDAQPLFSQLTNCSQPLNCFLLIITPGQAHALLLERQNPNIAIIL